MEEKDNLQHLGKSLTSRCGLPGAPFEGFKGIAEGAPHTVPQPDRSWVPSVNSRGPFGDLSQAHNPISTVISGTVSVNAFI